MFGQSSPLQSCSKDGGKVILRFPVAESSLFGFGRDWILAFERWVAWVLLGIGFPGRMWATSVIFDGIPD